MSTSAFRCDKSFIDTRKSTSLDWITSIPSQMPLKTFLLSMRTRSNTWSVKLAKYHYLQECVLLLLKVTSTPKTRTFKILPATKTTTIQTWRKARLGLLANHCRVNVLRNSTIPSFFGGMTLKMLLLWARVCGLVVALSGVLPKEGCVLNQLCSGVCTRTLAFVHYTTCLSTLSTCPHIHNTCGHTCPHIELVHIYS